MLQLGSAFYNQKNYAEAVGHYERAIEAAPDSAVTAEAHLHAANSLYMLKVPPQSIIIPVSAC